jgi:hypothetical protein
MGGDSELVRPIALAEDCRVLRMDSVDPEVIAKFFLVTGLVALVQAVQHVQTMKVSFVGKKET